MMRIITVALVVFLSGCAAGPKTIPAETSARSQDPDRLLVIDCLLPGQMRKLGQGMTYLTPRRPIKTSAVDCEIRGGEYVAYDRASYATALKIWLPKAKEGDPAAQTYVGEIYEKGLGIQADYRLAAEWYRRAAEQGYGRAQINLGYLYEGGLGVARDLTTAMNWYRKASGLIGGELEFVSSIESARREAVQQEAVQLREEVGQLRGELAEAQEALDKRRASLKTSQREARALRKELEAKKRQLAVAQEAPALSPAQSLSADARLALEQELTEAQKEQARLISKLAAQQLEASGLRGELAELQAALERGQQELQTAQRDLAQARQELSERQSRTDASASNAREIPRLQSRIGYLEAVIKDQSAALALLETKRSSQGSQLDSKLKEAEQNEVRLRAELAARNEELASLRVQLSERGQAVGDLESQLQEAQAEQQRLSARLASQQLETTNQQRDALQGQQQLQLALNSRNEEIASLEAQLSDAREALAGAANSNSQVAALETRLQAREAEIKQQEQEIARLQDKLVSSRGRLEQSEFAAVVEARRVGPAIEIIEPPLSLTRGTPSVMLRSAMPELGIIGRVTPPGDVLSLRINDRPQALDESGLFEVNLAVHEPDTPVSVVAVDRTGSRAALDFVIFPKEIAKAQEPEPATGGAHSVPLADFGEYYALIIGNNGYMNLPKLRTARKDAEAVEEILRTKYGFKTELLLDADRYTMLSAFNRYREQLTENDNLLIYYAGHGELDGVNLRGHWLPVDAEPDSSANWISNVAITDILNVMSAKHVLVVADSCYSGSLTRASIARLATGMTDDARAQWYQTMSKARTRAVLTSGGVKPVLDAGGGDHSVFAKAFLDVLHENEQILEGYRLYREVQTRVKRAAARLRVDQDPQYAPIKYAGHEAGEFFFMPAALGQAALHEPESTRLVALTR